MSQGLRLDRRLTALVEAVERLGRKTEKDYYDTREFAALANLEAATVREACRDGRLKGEKAQCGRGNRKEWRIAHEEYLRHQKEGWRPVGVS